MLEGGSWRIKQGPVHTDRDELGSLPAADGYAGSEVASGTWLAGPAAVVSVDHAMRVCSFYYSKERVCGRYVNESRRGGGGYGPRLPQHEHFAELGSGRVIIRSEGAIGVAVPTPRQYRYWTAS